MAVSGRYLRSYLKIQAVDPDAKAASTFDVYISGYYHCKEILYNNFEGRWRGRFNISNIGHKFKYNDAGQENFLTTNLKEGGRMDLILDTAIK